MDTATYEYWPQGWLKKVTFANGTAVEYTYDNAGNRLTETIICGGSC